MLSEFCPDIFPWADIALALPVFTYGQNLRYYLYICDKYNYLHNKYVDIKFSVKDFRRSIQAKCNVILFSGFRE